MAEYRESKDMGCPLCQVWEREPDNVFYEDEKWAVVRTLNLKGHRERIQIVLKEHRANASKDERNESINILKKISEKVFDYTYKVIILDGTYGSIPQHFHMVATDLEPYCEDFHQILGTPWLKVIQIKLWR